MGSWQSTLTIEKPNWLGVWKSSYYNGSVFGKMSTNLPDDIIPGKEYKIDVLIEYDKRSVYRPGAIVKTEFTGKLENGNAELQRGDSIGMFLKMQSVGIIQTLTYVANNVDLKKGEIKGTYGSNMPYDEGVFLLRRVDNPTPLLT